MTKLTVTHDLQFRGILLRFLARTLPLTHPSGKNQLNAMDGNSIKHMRRLLKLNTLWAMTSTRQTVIKRDIRLIDQNWLENTEGTLLKWENSLIETMCNHLNPSFKSLHSIRQSLTEFNYRMQFMESVKHLKHNKYRTTQDYWRVQTLRVRWVLLTVSLLLVNG